MSVVTSAVGFVDETGIVPFFTGIVSPTEYFASSLSSAMMLGAEIAVELLTVASAWNTTPYDGKLVPSSVAAPPVTALPSRPPTSPVADASVETLVDASCAVWTPPTTTPPLDVGDRAVLRHADVRRVVGAEIDDHGLDVDLAARLVELVDHVLERQKVMTGRHHDQLVRRLVGDHVRLPFEARASRSTTVPTSPSQVAPARPPRPACSPPVATAADVLPLIASLSTFATSSAIAALSR